MANLFLLPLRAPQKKELYLFMLPFLVLLLFHGILRLQERERQLILLSHRGEKKLAPLTAEEWNKYCANVQEVAEYKGVTLSSMPTVSRYATMEKDTINNIINKLRTIPDINTSKIPAIVTKGQPIKASTFIGLRDAINSVP